MEKYLTVRELDDGFILPIALCCGIVNKEGFVLVPEQKRGDN